MIKRNLENYIVHDLISALFVFKRVCTSKRIFTNVMADIQDLFSNRFLRHKEYFASDQMLISKYRCAFKVIDAIRKSA